MSDQPLPNPESDADVVLFALTNMGSGTYATLAVATGLSKPAISAAVTDLTKRGLVTGKSGTYSLTGAAPTPVTEPKAATAEVPPPPPPEPDTKKRQRKEKPKKTESATETSGSDDDAETVRAALENLGSGTYAALAAATGLSKIAVSAAITDLTKRGLVAGKAGEYSLTDGTKPAAEPKAAATPKPAPKQPKASPTPSDSADDAETVLAALESMGSGNYAALAAATGLSKVAVSAAITDLTKRGLVAGKAGEYSVTDGTKPAATPTSTSKQPKAGAPASAPGASLVDELERLAALRDAGALTATEFTKAKKKLLDAG